MTEQNKDMFTPFVEVVTNKIQKHTEQIAGIQEKLKTIPDVMPDLKEIRKELTDIKVAITAIKFPTIHMEELSGNLVANVALLKHPTENKVLHHHHVPKVILVSAILFVALCLVCCGWYNTSGKLEQYRMSDTKYRFLKLQKNEPLQQILFKTDSLCQVQSGMRETVIHKEDSIRQRIQQLQQIEEKEMEIKRLQKRLQ